MNGQLYIPQPGDYDIIRKYEGKFKLISHQDLVEMAE